MSYDLAVWGGERPAGDSAAAQCFTDLYDKCIDADGADVPPTKQIAAYVAALLERWPDLTEVDPLPSRAGNGNAPSEGAKHGRNRQP